MLKRPKYLMIFRVEFLKAKFGVGIIKCITFSDWCFPGGSVIKNPPANCRRHKRYRFDPWVRKSTWSQKWQHIPAFLPGNFHRQRSLVGYRSGGHKD